MKKKEFIVSDFLVAVLIAVMTILYVSLIFNQNIWTDEAFTMELVNSNSITGIIKGTAADAMETQDDGPGLGFFTSVDTAGREEEGQELTYAGFGVENGNLKISFEYLNPLYKWDYLAYYLFVIFIMAKILKAKY